MVVNGDAGNVAVDLLNSSIHDIGDVPFNGNQRGVAIYYRGYFAGVGPRGRISGNTISAYQKGGIVTNGGLTNNYGGFGYQAGVADVGNNDKIITNRISGPGYDPDANPSAYTVKIDADVSFTNRPKVHANK